MIFTEVKIRVVKALLFIISALVIAPSLALDILSISDNDQEMTFKAYFLMFLALFFWGLAAFISLMEYVFRNDNDFNKYKKIFSASVMASLVLSISLIPTLKFLNNYGVDKIYNDKVNNLANLSATLQYYYEGSTIKDQVAQSYSIKRDLISNVVEIENYNINDAIRTEEGRTFIDLLGILMYYDNSLVDSYKEQSQDIINKKKGILAKRMYDQTFATYDSYRKDRMKDYKEIVDRYNAQVKGQGAFGNNINKDYDYLNSLIDSEWRNFQGFKSEFDRNLPKAAQYFVFKEKKKLMSILKKLVDPKCQNGTKCYATMERNYLKSYGKYTTNFDVWLTISKGTNTTYALTETTKAVMSGGLSLAYQLNPEYHKDQMARVHKKVPEDDEHYMNIFMQLTKINFSSQQFPYPYNISYNEFKNSQRLLDRVIYTFNKNKGYAINGSAIKNRELFNKLATNYYAPKYKVKEPISFETFEKSPVLQKEISDLLNVKNTYISLKMNNEQFKKLIIDNKVNNFVYKDVSLKEKFKSTLMPYYSLIFVVTLTLLSFCGILYHFAVLILTGVQSLLKINNIHQSALVGLWLSVYISLFAVTLTSSKNFDLDESLKVPDMKILSNEIRDGHPLVNFSINYIMWSQEKIRDFDNFKQENHVDKLLDFYNEYVSNPRAAYKASKI